MEFECFRSDRDQGWAVEAINQDGEGEVSRVLFTGYKAQALAREYTTWKNASNQSQRQAEPHTVEA